MFKKSLRNWVENERGAVAVYLALGTVFLFPMIALAIDATNYYKLNTELKQAADAAALAAATKLDFTDAGLVAADTAARTAVQNFETGANDTQSSNVDITTVQFLRALPPAGNYNYNDYVTTQGSKARYVHVITETRIRWSSAYVALVNLWGGNDQNSLKPTASDAVAGKVTVACKALPMMMCNPAETGVDSNGQPCGNSSFIPPGDPNTSYSLFSDFLKAHPEWRRHQFRIKWIGNNSSIVPGVFGLLRPLTGDFGNGAGAIRDELGQIDPANCFEIQDAQVDIKTGQAATIADALNVRFDIFRGPMGSSRNDPGYAPALNRTKGRLPSGNGQNARCDPDETTAQPPDATKLLQDSCFANPASNSCGNLGPSNNQGNFNGRYGDGKWDAVSYFNINHPRTDGTTWNSSQTKLDQLNTLLQFIHNNYGSDYGVDATAVNTTLPPSRWAVYKWETAGSTVGGARKSGEPSVGLPNITGAVPDRIPGAHTRINVITKEEGRANVTGNAGAQCSNQTPLGPTRRRLYIAVVNCCEQADALSGGDRHVAVTEFAEAFLTEPVCHGSVCDNSGVTGNDPDKGAIYVEIYNAVKAKDADQVVLRDYVQLY